MVRITKGIQINQGRNPELIQKLNVVANKIPIPIPPNSLAKFGLEKFLDEKLAELGILPDQVDAVYQTLTESVPAQSAAVA